MNAKRGPWGNRKAIDYSPHKCGSEEKLHKIRAARKTKVQIEVNEKRKNIKTINSRKKRKITWIPDTK